MNNKFYELESEKQLAVINAGLEVFANNEYKKASTQEIATKSGVSKSLLFYYFHNKQELYEFLFSYATDIVKENVVQNDFIKLTDFFEIMEYATNVKIKILSNTPHILNFLTRSYYAENSEIKDNLGKSNSEIVKNNYDTYFNNINTEKFKDGINPRDIYEMLMYMSIGYIYEEQKYNNNISIETIMKKYETWYTILKNSVYKPEFL